MPIGDTCMKLIPARNILNKAEQAGKLKPGGTIIESTSGTFGLALAILAALRGYRLILVGDTAIDRCIETRLLALGAKVEKIDPTMKGIEGPQVRRVKRVMELLAEIPGAFWPQQYDNEENANSYTSFAAQVTLNVRKIDYLVGTVGTGGSMSGTASALRVKRPNLKVVGVDTHSSVLFGHPPGPRLLRGLGNSLLPKNVKHEEFDAIHWVTAAEAYAQANQLHQRHGLFMGGTSGAAFLVSKWIAAHNPDKQVLVIFPDSGHRYADTVYNLEYLSALSDWKGIHECVKNPVQVLYPAEVLDRWSTFDWSRRSLNQVALASALIAESRGNWQNGTRH